VGVRDVPLELLLIGLAQDRLLVGFRKPGEHVDIARRADDARDPCRRVARSPRIPAGFTNGIVELLDGRLVGTLGDAPSAVQSSITSRIAGPVPALGRPLAAAVVSVAGGPLVTRDEAQSCSSRALATKPGWRFTSERNLKTIFNEGFF
jgi:hypothetical protein